jgi:hypothetical protein
MNVESLELTEAEMDVARREIERLAFEEWERAGCPDADPVLFWRAAERRWIAFRYVPDRDFEMQFDGP